jgi:hypothetical protein
MRKKGTVLVYLLALAMACLLILAACGDVKGIPEPPPGAEIMADEELEVSRAELVDATKAVMGVSTVEYEVYLLPYDVAFETVRAHYEEMLSSDWQSAETENVQQARAQGIDAVIWNNLETEQVLSLQYVRVEQFGGNMLVVMYAEK